MISFDAPLRQLSFVSFDTETTGLSASHDRVVELSALRFRLDGSEEAVFDELINPGRPIPDVASRVNKIDDAMVADKPAAAEVMPQFLALGKDTVWLAHNADFDLNFLAHEAARCSLNLPTPPVLDTVDMFRALRTDLPNYKLETISRAIGLGAPTYHRALADAQTLSRIFLHLVAESYASRTLGELIADTGCALTCGAPDQLRAWLPPALKAIDEALQTGAQVTLLYEPEGKRADIPEIRPQGYVRRSGDTFLVARGQDGTDRNYRVDWIKRAHLAQATLF